MRKTVKVNDPDFGPVELPDEPGPTKAEWEAARARLREALRTRRAWEPGRAYRCPRCGARAFMGRDDISIQFAREGKVYVFAHLHGARCERCGAQTVEGYDQLRLDEETAAGLRPDYEAKVNKIGSGSLGTYWPRDIERLFHLVPDTKVFIEPAGPDAVIVRFRGRKRRGGSADVS